MTKKELEEQNTRLSNSELELRKKTTQLLAEIENLNKELADAQREIAKLNEGIEAMTNDRDRFYDLVHEQDKVLRSIKRLMDENATDEDGANVSQWLADEQR